MGTWLLGKSYVNCLAMLAGGNFRNCCSNGGRIGSQSRHYTGMNAMRMREFLRFLVGLGLLLGVVGAQAGWRVDGEASGQASTAGGESPIAGANVSVSNSSPQVTVINSGANGKAISLAVSDADNAAYVKAVTGRTAGDPVALDADNNSYATTNSPAALNFDTADSFSIEGWIYCKNDYYKETYTEPVIGKLDGSSRGWMLSAWTSEYHNYWTFDFRLTDTDGSFIQQSYRTANLTVSTWFHVIGTYDGSGVKGGVNLYIDSVLDSGTQDSSGTMDTLAKWKSAIEKLCFFDTIVDVFSSKTTTVSSSCKFFR